MNKEEQERVKRTEQGRHKRQEVHASEKARYGLITGK